MEMFREMAVFTQVVEEGGFSQAARKLGMTTSAVSRHVSRLEAYLGARLLQRTTRAVSATEVGQQVYELSSNMLANARAVTALAGRYDETPTGTLHISAPVVLGQTWIARHIPAFLEQYANVGVRLTLVDRMVDLVDEGVDLAIRIATDFPPGLVARRLKRFTYLLVASPAYLERRGMPEGPDDLINHVCIYLGYGPFGHNLTLRQGTVTSKVSISARMTINNSAGIVEAACANGGIGLVPDFAVRDLLRTGSLVPILPQWEIASPYIGDIFALYMPGKPALLKVRVFIDHLLEIEAGRNS